MKNTKIMILAVVGTLTMSSYPMQGPSMAKPGKKVVKGSNQPAQGSGSNRYNRLLQKIREKTPGAGALDQAHLPKAAAKVVNQDDVEEGMCGICMEADSDFASVFGCNLHNACKSCFDQWAAKQQGCPFCRQ